MTTIMQFLQIFLQLSARTGELQLPLHSSVIDVTGVSHWVDDHGMQHVCVRWDGSAIRWNPLHPEDWEVM